MTDEITKAYQDLKQLFDDGLIRMGKTVWTNDEPDVDGWKPIETAPKNEWILAYQSNGTGFTGGHCYVCQWAYDDQFWYDKTSNILEIKRLEDKVTTYLTCVPTHWMPLPEPPK
jgi:hypothetical protein